MYNVRHYTSNLSLTLFESAMKNVKYPQQQELMAAEALKRSGFTGTAINFGSSLFFQNPKHVVFMSNVVCKCE